MFCVLSVAVPASITRTPPLRASSNVSSINAVHRNGRTPPPKSAPTFLRRSVSFLLNVATYNFAAVSWVETTHTVIFIISPSVFSSALERSNSVASVSQQVQKMFAKPKERTTRNGTKSNSRLTVNNTLPCCHFCLPNKLPQINLILLGPLLGGEKNGRDPAPQKRKT